MRTCSGDFFGRHSRPLFLKSPTSSFFLVSTEMTGALRPMLLHAGVEILELCVAVGVMAAFAGLAIALLAVAEAAQKLGHDVGADVMLQVSQGCRQLLQALRRPQQRRHRVAACCGLQ